MTQRLKRCAEKKRIARARYLIRRSTVRLVGWSCAYPFSQIDKRMLQLSLRVTSALGIRIPRSLRAMAREIEREAAK